MKTIAAAAATILMTLSLGAGMPGYTADMYVDDQIAHCESQGKQYDEAEDYCYYSSPATARALKAYRLTNPGLTFQDGTEVHIQPRTSLSYFDTHLHTDGEYN